MNIKLGELGGMDFSDVAEGGKLPPVHPGEILREEFMIPLGLSSNAVAIALQVPAPRINDTTSAARAAAKEQHN